MKTDIRPITATDAFAIASIHAESWRSAYRGILRDEYLDIDLIGNRVAIWTKRLHPMPARHFGYIAAANGEPVGFTFAFGAHDVRWGTQIDNLHVLPRLKGGGLGRTLLAAFAQHACEHYSGAGVYLWVYERNVAARGFYERIGGVLAEQVDVMAPDGRLLPECRYVWESPVHLLNHCRMTAHDDQRR